MKISVFKVSLIKEYTLPYTNVPELHDPASVADAVRTYLQGTDREHFIVLFLDAKRSVIGIHTVSIGDLTSSIVHPREVFKGVILANADSIICAHNHPSGVAIPSDADHEITRTLVKSGKVLRMRVADHVIVGDGVFFSFRQAGLL